MAEQIERQTAYLTPLAALVSGTFIRGTAQMQPSYIETKTGRKVSRVHLLAVIVARAEEGFAEVTLDDGTGKIVARSFDNPSFFVAVQLGDIVRIIGKVRSFNDQVYIIPEIMKLVTNKNWVMLHKLLIQQHEKFQQASQPVTISELTENIPERGEEEVVEEVIPFIDENEAPHSLAEDMLHHIKELDTGDGALMETVLAKGWEDGERILQNLLETGEIYEIRPGRIKVLE